MKLQVHHLLVNSNGDITFNQIMEDPIIQQGFQQLYGLLTQNQARVALIKNCLRTFVMDQRTQYRQQRQRSSNSDFRPQKENGDLDDFLNLQTQQIDMLMDQMECQEQRIQNL